VHSTADREVRTVRGFCRICTSVCGILVDVAGDKVVRVRGDQDHPLSHGYTCAKGRALPLHHHPDRIEQPSMEVDGRMQPTTWDACLDDLGFRVRDIIDRHGPGAVGVFFGSGVGMDAAGYRMAQALYAAIGTPAKFSPLTIDGTAKVLVSDLVGGSAALSVRPDYDRAKLVMFLRRAEERAQVRRARHHGPDRHRGPPTADLHDDRAGQERQVGARAPVEAWQCDCSKQNLVTIKLDLS
jgi:anaerobic selenocysteine-containing dehydrogenase